MHSARILRQRVTLEFVTRPKHQDDLGLSQEIRHGYRKRRLLLAHLEATDSS
jgi:hypothetical protein